MSSNRISRPLVREAPLLRKDTTVEDAIRAILDSGLPALPVVETDDHLVGVFGEREFLIALFPGYVGELRFAGFVRKGLDDALEKRAACRKEPVGRHMTTDHVEVPEDVSDVHVAETFLHHRVLILPVCGEDGIKGVITRSDFFSHLAGRFLDATTD
jgi:CBS domain-containing protein